MRAYLVFLTTLLVLPGCDEDAAVVTAPPAATSLARVCQPDAALVDAGYAALSQGRLLQGVLPVQAMRHLYIAWTEDLAELYGYYTNEEAYWVDFNERYGTIPSAFEGATYPSGFGVADNGDVGVDCLLCHAGRLDDKTVIGLSNNRLDLRGLIDDLRALPAAIAALKARDLPEPYGSLIAAVPDTPVPEPYASLEIHTGAAGLNDGFGLGFVTASEYREPPAGMRTFMGYQDAPSWLGIPFKDRLYTDGSATAHGIYTMMSTLLAFGLSYAELASYVPTFEAIRQYQCSLEAPRWADSSLPPIQTELASRGAALFAERCATCHGNYDEGAFPNAIVPPHEIGTDPLRATNFGMVEADYFNDFIPAEQYEMTATGGYLAPALAGIWATAPYLHNGSVPTLRALLDPAARPIRWRRAGEDFNALDVGLSFETVAEPGDRDTIDGRKIVDTTVEGLDSGGHDHGLTPADVDALLEYLKTL